MPSNSTKKVGGSLCGGPGEGKLREFDSCRGEMYVFMKPVH